MDIKADTTDQSVSFGAWTTATGEAVTVTSATAGLSLWYRRGGTGAKTAISPSDLATLATAHSDGGILVVEGAEHRLDLPDAAVAAGVSYVEWGGTATDITIDGGRAELIGQANTATDVSHIAGTAQTGLDLAANWTAERAAKVDNLDVAVSSRAAATVCTEARLAELDAANLPATTDAILADTAHIDAAFETV